MNRWCSEVNKESTSRERTLSLDPSRQRLLARDDRQFKMLERLSKNEVVWLESVSATRVEVDVL